MSYETFEIRGHGSDGKVAHLVLNRPDDLNSMTPAMWRELPAVVERISASGRARALVISAEGRHFCSGMDLAVFTGASDEPSPFAPATAAKGPARGLAFAHLVRELQHAISTVEQARMPVLAAIQGGCVGGALDLAAACDMRYCTNDAFFTVQETNIGLVADLGSLQRLPGLIGDGMTRELAYTGRRLGADEALRLGLVNAVFDDHRRLVEGVLAIAAEIATKSPSVVHGSKVAVRYSRDHSVAEALDHVALWQAGMLSPEEMAEAMAAHSEGRAADFADLPPQRPVF